MPVSSILSPPTFLTMFVIGATEATTLSFSVDVPPSLEEEVALLPEVVLLPSPAVNIDNDTPAIIATPKPIATIIPISFPLDSCPAICDLKPLLQRYYYL